MSHDTVILKLFEHNNWANQKIIEACASLNDEQLDTEILTTETKNIRRTLIHLIVTQQMWLERLQDTTMHFYDWVLNPPTFSELQQAANDIGEGLLALAQDQSFLSQQSKVHYHMGVNFEPWVIMIEVIIQAAEFREQVKIMISSLGITPPDVGGWFYGIQTNAVTQRRIRRDELK